MLKEIRIKNLTIIDNLTIEFAKGFNVLTGETGAGKSIIVDAIGLLLGNKASPDMLKSGEKDGMIEAYFDITENSILRDISIDCKDGVLLRRNISSEGKNRAFINDISVSIATLANVCGSLITIHGQHEHQTLLKKENHLLFVDLSGRLEDDLKSFRHQYDKTALLRKKLADLKGRIQDKEARVEILRYQINEINSIKLTPGEKELLQEKLNILINQVRLRELTETAYGLLYESEGSSVERLSLAISKIKEISNIDRGAVELLQMLEAARPLILDSALSLRHFKERYETDTAGIEQINERLEAIKRLEKKYKGTVEDVIKYLESAKQELSELESLEEETGALENEVKANEDKLLKMANELSDKRHYAAKQFENKVAEELKQVGFSYVDFKVAFIRKNILTGNGFDDIEFLFSANPSEPCKPLTKVASGGELSRIMLALKCVEIGCKTRDISYDLSPFLETLIFDEVDAGIGGITAQNVGARLKAISSKYQVLSITHLPQIAAIAGNHLAIEKKLYKDTVRVSVMTLKSEAREREIARMLSGKVTDASLKHACELLYV